LHALATRLGKQHLEWTITRGLVHHGVPEASEETTEPLAALEEVTRRTESAIFTFKDLHPFLREPGVVRRLRDVARALKVSYKTVILLGPVLELPPELEKDVTVVDYRLPSRDEIRKLLQRTIESIGDDDRVDASVTHEQLEELISAAQGLTAVEIDNVLHKSLVEKGRLDVDVVADEKRQTIRKSGVLEYVEAVEQFADVGGLDALKDWLRKRAGAFSQAAREFGLPYPKGILLLGVQGCGKSLTAKAVSSLYRLPLLRLDVGRIFSGIVGSSEQRARRAMRIADCVAPAVLWVDEIDRGFAGTESSAFSDAGTTSRVFAGFVTWLQEKDSPVFVIATANDVSNLPPELVRKGRFDEIFFVDLPSTREREEILCIHLAKRDRRPEDFDLARLAQEAAGFSGAEIEQAIISALYDAFYEGRDIVTEDIARAIRQTRPLSQTMRENIQALREWARERARPASVTAETKQEQERG
ncbi:MAG: AAA family ATPase, partial [Armatimonadota bacterium]